MNRNDLVFLALMTALAAIASAPPLPLARGRWDVAEAGPSARFDQARDLALELSLASVP